MATVRALNSQEERTFLRVPTDLAIAFTTKNGESGKALAFDVGRGGLGINLQRYLRPGHRLLVKTVNGEELKAQVAWCRPEPGATFKAGIRVINDEPAATDTMAAILYGAVLSMEKHAPQETAAKIDWRNSLTQPCAAGIGIAATASAVAQHVWQ